MVYLRKHGLSISTFRFGQEFTYGSGGPPLQFSLSQPVFPGDTIFVNIRAGIGLMNSMPGFATIANTGGLYTGARVVDVTDTGTYQFFWTHGASNMNVQAMVSGVSLGYQSGQAVSFADFSTSCPLGAIAIPKNATVLYYYTSSGGPTATGRTITPSDYTQALGAGLFRQSHYKKFLEPTSEGVTLNWTGGHGGTTRVSRVVILGTD